MSTLFIIPRPFTRPPSICHARRPCARLLKRAATLAPRGLPHVVDIRNYGLILGLELEPTQIEQIFGTLREVLSAQ